jgi:protein TonB
MVASTAVETEPSAPVAAPLEQDAPSTPAPSAADVATAPIQPRDTSPVPPPPAPLAASGQPSAPRADYSWLQRAVSHRLEELKRSSRPSLEDSSRLKVLVRAVVSGTGELMEAEVVKSSGLERIDREAMTLVQRAFPMPFDHALDRPQIVMRIPITYSRD